MTLKTKCSCGNEFYMSLTNETAANMQFAKERFEEWREMHLNCYNQIHRVDSEEFDLEDLIRRDDMRL